MSRINLLLSIMPYEVETYVRLKETDGEFLLIAGYVDTGADKSLFPIKLLETIEHTILNSDIEIQQAGIAQQYFKAVEAKITLYFEDLQGNVSHKMEARAWFAETDDVLIGIQDVLEHATIFIDFRQTRTGWIEFD
jgi:hypothetical protein